MSAAARFLNQFRSPLIDILLVSAALTFALGEYSDTGIIMAALFLNATIGFFQEHRAERALMALRQLTAARAAVLRGGSRQGGRQQRPRTRRRVAAGVGNESPCRREAA